MKKITADYHLHSDVSPDCKTPMEESCEAAIQKGLTELTFTEHMEMFSGNFKRYPVSYMQQYFGNLARCREKFAGKLVLKAGVELGQGQVDREWEKTIIDLFPFDFIIGSVHKMDNVDMGKMPMRHRPNGLSSRIWNICGNWWTPVILIRWAMWIW